MTPLEQLEGLKKELDDELLKYEWLAPSSINNALDRAFDLGRREQHLKDKMAVFSGSGGKVHPNVATNLAAVAPSEEKACTCDAEKCGNHPYTTTIMEENVWIEGRLNHPAITFDLTHRVPDIVKADHTCDFENTPVACHFDTVTGPVDLMQCEICKKVWARRA